MKRISLFIASVFSAHLSAENVIDTLFKTIKNAAQEQKTTQHLEALKKILDTEPSVHVDQTCQESKFFKNITPLAYAMDLAIATGNRGPFEVLLERSNPEAKIMGALTLMGAVEAAERNAAQEQKANASEIKQLVERYYENKFPGRQGRPHSSPF